MKTKILSLIACLFTSSLFAAHTNPGPRPSIVERSQWGARSPKCTISYMSALNRAVIHHTADSGQYRSTGLSYSKANVRGVQNYHMDVQGWCDVGYHFLVDKYGYIFAGRYNSAYAKPRGAHDAVNYNSFGFTAMGYFHPPYNNAPTWALRNSLWNVIAWKMPGGWSSYGGSVYTRSSEGRLTTHRDVGPTACPGDKLYVYVGGNWYGGTARSSVNARRR